MSGKVRNASVLFGRQAQAELEAAARPARKPEACACLTGCFKGLLDSFGGGSYQDDQADGDVYSEPRQLEELEGARHWSELSEEERGGLIVAYASCVKEDTPGWTNQDSLLACVPAPSSKAGEAATSADDDPWESYEAYGAPAAADVAEGGTVRHLLVGVLDGHGRLGHEVSRLAASRIPGHLIAQPSFARDPGRALSAAVAKADRDVYKRLARNIEYNGSTAVIVCMDTKQKVLHCANVGDSRAVLGRLHKDAKDPRWETVPLTEDIKPDMPGEKERIEMSGGVVAPARIDGEFAGPQRVWEDWSLTKPGLAMGRSIGDGCARRIGIIAEPKMSSHKLRPDDRFVILASDGLWDALSSEDAVSIAARHIDTPQAVPSALIDAARERQEGELEDDTTIVMLVFAA